MRYIMLMSTAPQPAAQYSAPPAEVIAAMDAYNTQMREAGVMLGGEGLHPIEESSRLRFDRVGDPTVTDGPFAEAKEVVAGFWEIEVRSHAEALEWARRAPLGGGTVLELRQIFDGPLPDPAAAPSTTTAVSA